MYLIQQVTADSKQTQSLLLPDGSTIQIAMEYKPMQYGWFITSLVYAGFTLNGVRICTSPNLLHQYKNQIPFGLACYTDGNHEPMLQQDFSEGRSKLYILTAAEVTAYSRILSGG